MEEEIWKSSPFGENSIFHPDFDKKQQEEREQRTKKELSIKYIGCKTSENNTETETELTFEVKARNLKIGNATILFTNLFVPTNSDVIIPCNGIKRIVVFVPQTAMKNMPLWYGTTKLTATIMCDGIYAVSEQFELKCTPKPTCLCKKSSWTEEDLRHIVMELRKREIIIKDGRNIRNEKKEIIGKEDLTLYNDKNSKGEEIKDKIFYFNDDEKLEDKYINYSEFSKQLNRIFKDYKINTCIRKIHFLAQCYVETNRFRTTYEASPSGGYFGGKFYRGRGIKQITHDYNYLEYYCFLNKSELFKIYINKRKNDEESVTTFNSRTSNQYISVEEMKKVDELASKISTDMYYACDAAGWYWEKCNINKYADDDDIIGVSAKVNNPSAVDTTSTNKIRAYDDRYKFYIMLKNIFDYENCK